MATSLLRRHFRHHVVQESGAIRIKLLRLSTPSFQQARRLQSSDSAPFPQEATRSHLSFLRRAASIFGLSIAFTTIGFIMAAAPAYREVQEMSRPPSDSETLTMSLPEDDTAREVEAFINNHRLAAAMRSKPTFSESRPHMKIPAAHLQHNLTGGTLLGPGKVVVPPVVWAEEGGKSLVTISYLGTDLCGHPGIVHGGFLATMLDEGLARCCFAALPHNVGMTANLNINYRSPARAGSYVVLKAKTIKVEGRKAWVEGRIETLVDEGQGPIVIADATALFISPKAAAAMAAVSPARADK